MQQFWWVWLVGVAFLAAGGYLLWQGQQRLRAKQPPGWLLGSGVVVDHEAHSTGDDTFYLPVIEYPLPDGTPHRFTNPVTVATGLHRTGQSVEILVNPADPRQAQTRSTTTVVRAMGGIFAFLGISFIGGGLLIVLVMAVLTWLVSR